MTGKFDYFVMFAEMRTGSNFVEANLNTFEGINCHGEAFNPSFIGYPNRSEILGLTQEMREDDPKRLLTTIRDYSEGLGGFRFFHDHDHRVLDDILNDPRCAKIILTRNPADSYVSWKIARATGQWKLTDGKNRKDSLAVFDEDEFVDHLTALQDFQIRILNTLQKTGQTAFYLSYEDIQDVEIMNGIAKFLGVDEQIDSISKELKKQNPEPIEDKVQNFDKMADALARLDRFNLSRTPNFEPRRGANVPDFVAAQGAPLLYMPIKGGPTNAVKKWLSKLGEDRSGLIGQFSQKSLRQWKRGNKGHRSFTVVRHPLERAHDVFCRDILEQDGAFPKIRRTLRKRYKLPIPDTPYDLAYDIGEHKLAFVGFLNWLQKNLAEQTSVRIDAHWASQAQIIQGFGKFSLPDIVIREQDAAEELAWLASKVGLDEVSSLAKEEPVGKYSLADIYDNDVEKAAQATYSKDYMVFGFDRWKAD
jgi:LPS sulfotransferase NodH